MASYPSFFRQKRRTALKDSQNARTNLWSEVRLDGNFALKLTPIKPNHFLKALNNNYYFLHKYILAQKWEKIVSFGESK